MADPIQSQHEEVMAAIHSKLDALIDYFRMRSKGIEPPYFDDYIRMRSKGIEPPDFDGAHLDWNPDPEEPTLVSVADQLQAYDDAEMGSSTAAGNQIDDMLEINKALDSEENGGDESAIKHSFVDADTTRERIAIKHELESFPIHESAEKIDGDEPNAENDDNGGGVLPFTDLESILGSEGEGTVTRSANGSLKAWVEEVTSSMKVDLSQYVIDDVAHLLFDEKTKDIQFGVPGVDRGCKDVDFLTAIEVMFYFDPGGCSLSHMRRDPFELYGKQGDICLELNVDDALVKAKEYCTKAFGEKLETNGLSWRHVSSFEACKNIENNLFSVVVLFPNRGSCVTYIRNGSYGYFVKMIHKRIEYGDVTFVVARSFQLGNSTMDSEEMSNVAQHVESLIRELGEKSLAVKFEAVGIDKTVGWSMCGCFWTIKKISIITSCLLIQISSSTELVYRFVNWCQYFKVSDSLGAACRHGLVVIKLQYDKMFVFISTAENEVARQFVEFNGGRIIQPHSQLLQQSACSDGLMVQPSSSMTRLSLHMVLWCVPSNSCMTYCNEVELARLVLILKNYAESIHQENGKPSDVLVKHIGFLVVFQSGSTREFKTYFGEALARGINIMFFSPVDLALANVIQMHFIMNCLMNLQLVHFTANQFILGVFLEGSLVCVIIFCKEQSVQWPTLLQAFTSRYSIPFSIQLSGIESLYHDSLVHLQELGWKFDKNVNTKVVFLELVAISLRDLGVFKSDICEDEAVAISSALELDHLSAWPGPGDIENVLSFVERLNVRKLKVHKVAEEISDKLKDSPSKGINNMYSSHKSSLFHDDVCVVFISVEGHLASMKAEIIPPLIMNLEHRTYGCELDTNQPSCKFYNEWTHDNYLEMFLGLPCVLSYVWRADSDEDRKKWVNYAIVEADIISSSGSELDFDISFIHYIQPYVCLKDIDVSKDIVDAFKVNGATIDAFVWGSWYCLGFSCHHFEDKAVVEGKDLSCPEVEI